MCFPGRRALLHNIRFDEPVAAFSNASGTGTNDEAFLGGAPRSTAAGGACTAISFRTGISWGLPGPHSVAVLVTLAALLIILPESQCMVLMSWDRCTTW